MSSFSPMLAALFISLFLLLETATTTVAQGVNITEMLSSSSFGGQFTTFNDYLTKSGVADKISKMHAATVLVVANANASGLASLPAGAMEHTMEAHVIDDFYDADRLEETRQGEPLATLYQRTGHAIDREGFLFVTPPYKGTAMSFASASTRGSPARSILVAQLTKQPGHFSLLQITNFIQIPSLVPADASNPTASAAAGNSSSSSSSSSSPTPAHGSGPAASPPKSNSTSPASSPPSHTPSHAPASSPSANSSATPAPPPRPARAPTASPPQQQQPAAPPRKMLAPAPSTKPGGKAPTPSTSAAPTGATTPAAAEGPASSSVVTPPAAADVPASASASPTDAKSSGVSSGDHLQAMVMVFFASAWFLLAMI